MSLSSTTAPGKTFSSRNELANHYKSDWHKYNLKRREAGLPLLEEKEFQTRLEAALLLREEKEKKNGKGHIKNINSKKNKKKEAAATKKIEGPDASVSTSTPPIARMVAGEQEQEESSTADETTIERRRIPAGLAESQENPEIDPLQCLFDQHRSENLEQNVEYMQSKYGFFIPDQDCLVDLEGLLGYCHEKIKLGHYCLYCERIFPTWQACQQHMISKQHCKLRYEPGYWEELDPFYDFQRDDKEFLGEEDEHGKGMSKESIQKGELSEMEVDSNSNEDDDEDGWEDMSDDEDKEDDESEELYSGYEREIARFGLDVTALGELVFPDGRVVGHRALHRYYKQKLRLPSTSTNRTAVLAAQRAAGERIYGGQVVNINQQDLKLDKIRGAGKGILVAAGGSGSEGSGGLSSFSALSLYRYRAAVRKQRRGDEKGRRLRDKSFQNINRMDKKANRLMNGVSVAHAAR